VARKSPKRKAGLPPQPRKPPAPPPVRSTGGATAVERRRLLLWAGLAALAVLGVALGLVFTRGSSSSSTSRPIPWGQLGPLQTDPPPWNNGIAQLPDRLSYIGLDQLGSEGNVLHIHQHLDLYVNGRKVTLPAGVGIYGNSWLTQLHVHDTSGVIHVESPTNSTFRLGQLFAEWGVKLTANCVGRYCGRVEWWVDGTKMAGDPASLALKAHQEIVIAAGPPPAVVPKSYKFPAGE